MYMGGGEGKWGRASSGVDLPVVVMPVLKVNWGATLEALNTRCWVLVMWWGRWSSLLKCRS